MQQPMSIAEAELAYLRALAGSLENGMETLWKCQLLVDDAKTSSPVDLHTNLYN